MSYDTEVLADAPSVYLKLAEPSGTSAADSSGASRTGTCAGGVTFGAAGPFGSETAADLDGVDGRITAPSGSNTGGAFSVEAWVRFDVLPASVPAEIVGDGGGYSWEMRLNYGSMNVSFLGVGPGTALVADRWYYVVGTYAGGAGAVTRVYVDGLEVAAGTASISSFSTVSIGRRFDTYGPVDGKISRVAIYQTELSAARVAAHFAATSSSGAALGIDRDKVLTGSSGTVVLALTGSGTAWDGSTVFTASGVSGWTKASQSVTSATAATITVNRSTSTGTLTISDGTASDTVVATSAAATISGGNASSAATWDTHERPGAAHLATISAGTGAVAVDAGWTVGALTILDALTVNPGITLTVAGDVTQGDVAFNLIGNLVFDCTAADRKWLMGTVAYQTNCYFKSTGTSGAHATITKIGSNHCWIDGADEGSGSGVVSTSGFDLLYCDLTGIGKSDGSFSIRSNSSGGQDQDFRHCVFDGCGTLKITTWGASGNKDMRLEDLRFRNGMSGSYGFDITTSGSDGTGSRTLKRVSCDKNARLGIRAVVIEDVYFDTMVRMIGHTHVGFSGCLRSESSSSGTGTLVPCGNIADLYYLADHQDPLVNYGNQHYIQSGGSNETFDRIVFEFANSQYATGSLSDGGDGIFGSLDHSTMRNILSIPDAFEGVYSANLFNPLQSAPPGTTVNKVTIEHCSIIGKLANLLTYEYAQDGTPQVISFKSNLLASDDPATLRAYFAFEANPGAAGSDIVDPAQCTYNYIHNPAPFTDSVGGLTHDGWVCRFSANPAGPTYTTTGTGYATGPAFYDPTRRFAEWAVHKGAASSGDTYVAKKLASRGLLMDDPTLARTDLIPWVMAGWAPTAAVLDPATHPGHDGATIGAVAFNGGGGDTTPPTLSSCVVPTGGTTLTATLSESGCIPSSGTGGFTLGGTSTTVANWAISGTTLTLTLSGTIYSGQTVTLTYSRAATTNDISDAASNYLADFSAASITNSSTQAAPSGAGGGLIGSSALVSF